jgi:hypothetical protein
MKIGTLSVIIAFLGIMVIYSGCGDKNDPVCNCINKVHTDTICNCNAVGYDCNCTYEPSEQPKNQISTLTGLFETNDQHPEGYSVIVTSFLTDTEWEGVDEKIKTALNATFTNGNNPVKNRFRSVFGGDVFPMGITIVVEKTEEYNNCKTNFLFNNYSGYINGYTLYFNIDGLDDGNLQAIITSVVNEMNNGNITLDGVLRQQVATPSATPVSGIVEDNTAITLYCTTEEAKIRFDYNDNGWTFYSESNKPIITSPNKTLRIQACKTDMNYSEVVVITYTIE